MQSCIFQIFYIHLSVDQSLDCSYEDVGLKQRRAAQSPVSQPHPFAPLRWRTPQLASAAFASLSLFPVADQHYRQVSARRSASAGPVPAASLLCTCYWFSSPSAQRGNCAIMYSILELRTVCQRRYEIICTVSPLSVGSINLSAFLVTI